MRNVDKDKQAIFEGIQSLKAEIEKAHREGADTSSSREKLKMAASAYRSKDYETASKRLVECRDELDRLHQRVA